MDDKIAAIGLVFKALGELLYDKNPALAWTDLLKALGMFNLHNSIGMALETPPGKAMSFPVAKGDTPKPVK